MNAVAKALIEAQQPQQSAPEPLRRPIAASKPYPTEALGRTLGDAALAIHGTVRSSVAMAGNSVLAAASLAVQAHADVLIDGRPSPTSLYILTTAESGERKTATDNPALRAHREFQRELADKYVVECEEYRVRAGAHTAATKLAERRKNAKDIRDAMQACGVPPDPPLHPQLLVSEPTLEGLHKLMIAGRGTLGLFSDEGGQFFGGHTMSKDHVVRGAAGLSALWDGGMFDRVRAGDGATTLYGRRTAMHLMMQPIIAERVLSDTVLSGQGLLARCLWAWPDSTAGTRTYVENDLTADPVMGRYWRTMSALLRLPLPLREKTRNELHPRALTLASDAKLAWIACHNSIERRSGTDGEYSQIRSFSSKAPEQIARIAGVLAIIDNSDTGVVGLDAVERAAALVEFYLYETLRLVGIAETSMTTKRAEAVLAWCIGRRKDLVHSALLLQFGPAVIRERAHLRDAMSELERAGWAQEVEGGCELDGKHRRHVWHVRIEATL